MNVTAKALKGKADVSSLLLNIYERYQQQYTIMPAIMNHEYALLYYSGKRLISCQVFHFSAGNINSISTILNPEKLKA